MKSENNTPAIRLARLSLAGSLVFVACIVTLHFTQPSLSPIERAMSEYALHPTGWLFTLAVIALGLGALGLAAALRLSLPTAGSFLNLVLIALFGLAMIVTGFFPTDPVDPAATDLVLTTSGMVHASAGLVAYLCLSIAAPRLSKALGALYPPLAQIERLLAIAASIGFGLLMVTLFLPVAPLLGQASIVGLGERIMGVPFLGWQIVAALMLIRANQV